MEWQAFFFLLLNLYRCVDASITSSSLAFVSDVNFSLEALGPKHTRLRSTIRKTFKHPGLLHTNEDFARIKRQKQHGGWVEQRAYNQFVKDAFSNPHHALNGPYDHVTRGFIGDYEASWYAFVGDSQAARQLALLWAIDGNQKAGRKAIEILDAWGSSLKQFKGNGAQLAASLSGSTLIQAAEIMRYTSDFWNPANVSRFETMVREAILPAVSQTRPNEYQQLPFSGNWGTSAEKALIAISIFLNDHHLYQLGQKAIQFAPCANLTGIIHPTGQSSDSGRDQQHTQLGLGNYAEAFQMMWNQGDDFYSLADNRLLAGLEYTARFIGGKDVPFETNFFTCHCSVVGGPWKKISQEGRSSARPIFEMAYAHYTVIKGLKMPWTEKLIKRHTPDGQNTENTLTDGSSFQTLLFRQEASTELNQP
ncbi:chondroitin AC/alginate lyase [Melampsora americana]|nr:chondroitin AC/alginate lyase [Melampsora americana]